ncbi:MAG: hypothetical protein IJB76_02825 [Clostridia bacterium]|nr:hypothetical protein [Clostridia bacterium]
MKKIFKKELLENTNASILISAIVAIIGAYASLPTNGMISTIPFTLAISFLASFILTKPILLPCYFFVVSYMIAFLTDTPTELNSVLLGYALTFATKNTVFSFLGCLASMAIKNKSGAFKSSRAKVVIAVLLLTASTVIGAFANGTPWGYVKAKGEIERLINERFDVNELSVSTIYNIPGNNKYACDVTVNGKSDISSVVYLDGTLSENITEIIAGTITQESATKLTNVLREALPQKSFKVHCEYNGMYAEKLSLKNTESVSNYLKYSIDIYSEETAKTFINEAELYLSAIKDKGFLCTEIVINGGIRRKMLYSLHANPYAPESYIYYQYGTDLLP